MNKVMVALMLVGAASMQAQTYDTNKWGVFPMKITDNREHLVAPPVELPHASLTNQLAGLPNESVVRMWNGKGFDTYTKIANGWSSGADSVDLQRGKAFFIKKAGTTDYHHAWVGTVATAPATNEFDNVIEMVGCVVPRLGTAEDLNLRGNTGDYIGKWDPIKNQWNTNYWSPVDAWGTNELVGEYWEGFLFSQTGTWSNSFQLSDWVMEE